jgi:hypothetical protein
MNFTGALQFMQEIPREELEADDSDKVIGVFHFSKDLSRTHGVPFKFVVKRVRTVHLCRLSVFGS